MKSTDNAVTIKADIKNTQFSINASGFVTWGIILASIIIVYIIFHNRSRIGNHIKRQITRRKKK